MDLRKAILSAHNKSQANLIADYIGKNRARFKELVSIYLTGPYRITQRSSWPLTICVERDPGLIKPHFGQILAYLHTPGIHPAVSRNTLRLLQYVEIPATHYGRIVDICFGYLQQRQAPVAVKVFSISVLARIIKDEPALKRELRLIIENLMPYASPGLLSRARKILKEIGP